MKKTKFISIVLTLGGLWGLLEATLGTLLHLPSIHSIIFFASTAILLPIAYLITSRSYQLTNKASTVIYVGIVAALIKSVTFVFGLPIQYFINPMVAIMLESLVMFVAFKVTKHEKIISLKSFVTFIVVSTIFRVTYVGYSIATSAPFGSAYFVEGSIVIDEIVKYCFITNIISFAYLGIFMGLGTLLIYLEKHEKFSKFTSKVSSLTYSPIFASLVVCVAVVTTLFLK